MNTGTASGFTQSIKGLQSFPGGFFSASRGRLFGDDIRVFSWPMDDANGAADVSTGGTGHPAARYLAYNTQNALGRTQSAALPGDRGMVVNGFSGWCVTPGGLPFSSIFNTSGTVAVTGNGTAGCDSFEANTTVSNFPGVAVSLPVIGGFNCVNIIRADAAACTVGNANLVSYNSNTTCQIGSGGVLTGTNFYDFIATNTVNSGVTFTKRTCFFGQDLAGSSAGSATTQYGLELQTLVNGTSNYPVALNNNQTLTLTASMNSAIIVGNNTTLTMNAASINASGAVNYATAYVMEAASSAVFFDTVFWNSATYNTFPTAGSTLNLGPVNSFLAGYTKTVDTQTAINLRTDTDYGAKPVYTVANAGTFTSGNHIGYTSNATVNGTGCTLTSDIGYQYSITPTAGTVTTATGFKVNTPGAGTITNFFGVDIAAATTASTSNVGLRCTPAIVNPRTVVTVTSNAGTVPTSCCNAKLTNSSAATITVTMATAGALDGQITRVGILDFTGGASQTITWVNTENGKATAPTTTVGSTTIYTIAEFMFNSGTTKWTCIGVS